MTLSAEPLPIAWAEEIDRLLQDAGMIGTAIALVTPGGPHVHCFGRARDSGDAPIHERSLFNLCSQTKAFTATLAAVLAHHGIVDLDASVRPVLPELALQPGWVNEALSLRDLLSNRTGLRRGGVADFGLDVRFDNAEVVRRMSAQRSDGPFRGRYGYCNAGFGAAVLAIERITGRAFGDLFEEYVTGPAGMAPPLVGERARDADQRVTAHVFDRAGTRIEVDAPIDWVRPGPNGLLSSAAEQLRWLELNLGRGKVDGRQLLPESVWDDLWTPLAFVPRGQRPLWVCKPNATYAAYALGWFVTEYDGRPMVVHSGGSIGWAARIALLPEQGIGVAILMNSYETVGTVLLHRLLERCLDMPATDWTAEVAAHAARRRATDEAALDTDFPRSAAPAAPASDAYGTYRNAENGPVCIAAAGAGMTLSFADAPTWDGALHGLGGDVMEHAISGPIATFSGVDALSPRIRLDRAGGRVVAIEHSSMGRFERC